MTTKQAYPLHWPDNYPRTRTPVKSQFKTSVAGALKNVQNSLAAFSRESGKAISDLVISSNYTLLYNKPKEPGVALYFTWDGLSTCIAVDRYAKIEDNLQAIYHVLEAERTKMRHGGLAIVQAAFRGYTALPPPRGKHWSDILDVNPTGFLISEAEAKYKELAKKSHPDNGGTADRMAELNHAIACARKEYAS
jgi:hypothetical protein